MNTRSRRPCIAAAVAAVIASPVMAHDGHGLFGSHWHATDAWGFAGLAAAIAGAVWSSRGGKP